MSRFCCYFALYACYFSAFFLIISSVLVMNYHMTSGIFFTEKMYNGSLTYDGFLSACKEQYPTSSPCNEYNLLNKKYWRYPLQTSWVLSVTDNCLGYTTNSTEVLGKALLSFYPNGISTASCNMIIPLCCLV